MESNRNIFSRSATRLVAVMVLAFVFTGCVSRKIDDIAVTSFDVESVSPIGFRGAKVVLNVGVYNPTVGFTLSDIYGSFYYNGRVLAKFTADPVTVARHSDDVYRVSCDVSLDQSTTVLAAAGLLKSRNLDAITVDLHSIATVKPGFHKTIEYKNTPVTEFLPE